jgi:hypothetical protein
VTVAHVGTVTPASVTIEKPGLNTSDEASRKEGEEEDFRHSPPFVWPFWEHVDVSYGRKIQPSGTALRTELYCPKKETVLSVHKRV